MNTATWRHSCFKPRQNGTIKQGCDLPLFLGTSKIGDKLENRLQFDVPLYVILCGYICDHIMFDYNV